MPEYLAPGVYVEEIEIGGKPIEGVSTSTVAFLGESERGQTLREDGDTDPTHPRGPRLVTGWEEYRRLFGGYAWSVNSKPANSYLPYAVDGFFANGGKRCYITRVVGKKSVIATADVATPPPPQAPAAAPPPAAGPPAGPAPPAAGPPAGAAPAAAAAAPKSVGFTINAVGPGDWGNRVAIKLVPASLSQMDPKLFKLIVVYWEKAPPTPVVDPTDPTDLRKPTRTEPTLREDFDNLSTDSSSSDYFVKRVNGMSSLITIDASSIAAAQKAGGSALTFLKAGADGAGVSLAEYASGLESLEAIDDISIVCAPNEGSVPDLTDALIAHCERLKYRFAILQASQGDAGNISVLRPPLDSKYGAFYFPWLKIMDPATNVEKFVPPGGHIAGVYAKTDVERGVHKAPANEVVRLVTGIQVPITKADQEGLNPRGVNCIRVFPGRGIRVWGARTISSDPLWKYVNVRRLMIFLERSIDEGTQWLVFEPNDQRLWARVRQTITDFLTGVWKDGALMGLTPDQAFFVKCDETTMTPSDIDNGRLIVLIGVAPVKPAEFVIFRIAQWRSGSAISE